MHKSGIRVRICLVLVLCTIFMTMSWAQGEVVHGGTATVITTTRMDTEQNNPDIEGDLIAWQGRDSLDYTFDIILYNVMSGKEILLTPGTSETDQLYPSISQDLIVWEDGRNGNTDIFLYNCTSEELVLITPNSTESNQANPAVQGDRIVWQDNRNGNWDIYLFDLGTWNETRITHGATEEEFPDIHGPLIVWRETEPVNATTDIRVHNIETGVTFDPTPDTQSLIQEYHGIWGDNVVWHAIDVVNGTYDVYRCNITTGVIQILTPDTTTSDQKYPSVENDRIVWQDNRNGVWNIVLYDLATGTTSMLTNGTADQTRPVISGNRVVWQDDRAGIRQIYLLTLGVLSTCPVADFSANTTSGTLPFSVSFTDLSMGEPTHWRWDFGDGTGSDARNATHAYTNPGIYTVTLTINTPYCRDSKRIEYLITVGTPPLAQFSLNTTEGVAPLVVECLDESSGEPTEWTWDFGDGTNSTVQNPVHEFGPGTYSIRLNASNQFGSNALERTGILSVVNATKEQISWDIPGIEVLNEEERQRIVVNTSQVPVKHFDETLLELSGSAERNLQSVRFISGNNSIFEKSTDTTIEGNISGLTIESRPVGPAKEVLFDLTMPYYDQNGSIQSLIWENITPLDLEAARQAWFNITYGDVTGCAYTVQFLKTGENKTGPARIRMAVNSSWVKTQESLYGTEIQSEPAGASVYVDGIHRGETPISIAGPTAGTHQLVVAKDGYQDAVQPIFLGGIRIIRIGDEGVSEVLPTRYLYSDPDMNLDYFEADSPDGLSKFTIAGLSYAGNPFQLLTLFWTSHFGNTGSSSGGGGGYTSSAGGGGGGSMETVSTVNPKQTTITTPVVTPEETSVSELSRQSIADGTPATPEQTFDRGPAEPATTTPESIPGPNPIKSPLGIISGMIAWIGELTRGRYIFIFAAVAITVVSVIIIWQKGYLGRE